MWIFSGITHFHYIYDEQKEFLSEDTVNVSTDEEDATKCYPTPRLHSSL